MSADPDLLALFAAEAQEALERLSVEAMALESSAEGERGERIATMFRAAHSLKGSSRLVGLDAVGDVAHALEDVLGELRAGTLPVSTELVSLALRGVDVIATLLPDALAGVDQASAGAAAVAEIVAAGRALRRVGEAPAGDAPSVPDAPAPEVTRSAPATGDTVRVPAERVDAIGRLVGEALAAHAGLERLLGDGEDADERIAASLHGLRRVLQSLDGEARRARMVSFASVAGPLQRAARDVATGSGKAVEWEIAGGETQLDRQVLQQLRDPLLHLVRNAVDHGLESPAERAAAGKPAAGTVRVDAQTRGDQVTVTVSDDGRGVDHAAVADAARALGAEASIFAPGVSTSRTVTDVSGRGVGLDVVQDAVAQLRGRVSVHSQPGAGASFELKVPLSVASLRCVVVRAGGERYGLPLSACTTIVDDLDDRLHSVEGQTALELEGALHAVHDLGRLLHPDAPPASGPVVMTSSGGDDHALRVEGLEGQRDVVVKDLPPLAAALPAVSGASVEADGTIMLVLDAAGVVELAAASAVRARAAGHLGVDPAVEGASSPSGATARRHEILVVDDALTVRELQRSILGRAGFAVRTAVDGQDAVSQLGSARPDLVISDVEMPGMDGFMLTEAIRAHPGLSSLPVILVTSLGDDAHRRRGLEAGADAYLAKDTFDETALLQAIDQVLGAVA